eukprot:jgi/Bigna1/147026/aug1.127_g21734
MSASHIDLTQNPSFVEGRKEWVYDESRRPEWLVGKTLSVSWDTNGWFVGTVKSFDEKTGKHRIDYTDNDTRFHRFRERTWSVVGLPGHHIKEDPCPAYTGSSAEFPNIAGSLHAARKQLSDTKLQSHTADFDTLIGKKISSAASMLGNEIMDSIKEMAKKVDRKFKQIVIANKQLRKLLHRAGINRQDEGLDSEAMEEHVKEKEEILVVDLTRSKFRGTPVRSARDLFYKSDLCEENAFLDVNPSIMNDILDRLKYDMPHPMHNGIYKATIDYLCINTKPKQSR